MENIFEKSLERYFTHEQLVKIRSVKVGIAGAGGLGSNCAMNLVRSGFRNFVICDFDVVEGSNLNRQFYFTDQIGEFKVEALKQNLLRINPSLNLEIHRKKLEAGDSTKLFADCDAVVEAFDKAECKQMIAEEFFDSGKFFVAASGLAGWGNSDRITIRRVHAAFHMAGDFTSEVGAGVPPCSPRVNIAAAKEADLILNWVLSR